MSGISTRIEKGQTRFAPKLKARPNKRATTAASEDSASVQQTPPLTTHNGDGGNAAAGADQSGSFGASLIEGDDGTATSAGDKSASDLVSTPSSSVNSPSLSATATTTSPIVPGSASRRLSTQAGNHSTSTNEPTSPASPATRVIERPNQGIAISFPSSSPSSSPNEPSSSTSSPQSRSAKGASIITVPSARKRIDDDGDGTDNGDGEGGGNSSRKKAKGKHLIRGNGHRSTTGEGGENEELDGEDVLPDYSDTPMYEFVKDMGVGRRSAVFLERQKQMDEKRRIAKKEKRIKDIQDEEGSGKDRASMTPQPDEDDELEAKEKADVKSKSNMSTPKTPIQPKTFAPQVRVVDGRIELDIDSLTVDHAAVDGVEQGPIEYVEESSTSKFVNSATFSTKFRSEKWTETETDLFYEAISQWGTDFGIICKLFPSKTRVAIRNKFKRED
ncbi:Transcription factor TFIIIB component B, partial [Podila epigama]